jgi:hypothetical protein
MLADFEAAGRQCRAHDLPKLLILAAHEDGFAIFIGIFTVDGQHDIGLTDQCEAYWLVETSAGDVQLGVARRFQTFKRVKENPRQRWRPRFLMFPVRSARAARQPQKCPSPGEPRSGSQSRRFHSGQDVELGYLSGICTTRIRRILKQHGQ